MRTKANKFSYFDIAISLLILSAAGYIIYRIKVSLHYNWNWGAIPQYLFRYDPDAEMWIPNVLIQGLLTTIRLSIWSTLLATLIGTVMGLCRVSQSLFKRLIARTYVEVMRNLPPLVLVFIIYYFLSDQIMTVLGLNDFLQSRSDFTLKILTILFAPPSLLPAFFSALIALAVFEGAYITEIVRAGIQSIERGIWEASY
ncbi:ABC transporter permease subunit, partial [Thermodesulfobacteriota bacterium]